MTKIEYTLSVNSFAEEYDTTSFKDTLLVTFPVEAHEYSKLWQKAAKEKKKIKVTLEIVDK